ncbi:hypothetical protein PI124_g16453 [Phytophthora idaei]|nr:hypothetical protein PI125_g2345 [Phytophthora idaei]KAG3139144.1 hypothetical protein PI126_g16597 [Phytophthora idaei]KAG3238594.1 hypothetical protein PI124_g16453 [Phytophthora idaei]
MNWCTSRERERERSQSVDRTASTALQQQKRTATTSETDREDFITPNLLPELLLPKDEEPIACVAAATRSRIRRKDTAEGLQSDVVQLVRTDRIQQAQNEEKWIADLKAYLSGELDQLDANAVRTCGKIADKYEVDESGLLLYCSRARMTAGKRDLVAKLVVPEALQEDILHHYNSNLEGGHQETGRTYQWMRLHFHWRGRSRVCNGMGGNARILRLGKGARRFKESRWVAYRRHIYRDGPCPIAAAISQRKHGATPMGRLIHRVYGGKASASRTAQTIAESYGECVFCRFGASDAIRHDREPGFMYDFFRAFNHIVGQRQRATMAYRPQANGTAERMVQTLTRPLKMYVADVNKKDWD